MNENNQLTEQENDYLLNLILGFNKYRNIENIEAFNNEIANANYPNFVDDISKIFIILKGISVTTIKNKKLSLQEYKDIFIQMKNLIIINQRNLKYLEIKEILLKLILILLDSNIEFIQYNNMVLIFLQLIKIIYDNNDELLKDKAQNENYFKIILDKISQKNQTKENFLIISKNSLLIYICLFETNIINEKNFLNLMQNYIVPICDIIFNSTQIYIIPFVNYDIEFISILKSLYELLITCLKKMKRFFPSIKRKEISNNIFIKYGRYSLDLIKLIPNLKNEENILNNILVFKEDYNEFNDMKSNIFLFLCYILENPIITSNNEINSEIINIIFQIIKLVEESLKQILENENIFLKLRKIEEDELEGNEKSYNILLYNMLYFLCKSIIKEPIKTEFKNNIQLFLLDIIFPLLVTFDNEKSYMKREPEQYCIYLNDILYNLKLKNFRTAGLILIKKISENFEDIPNFIFSYIIGMLEDLLLFNGNNNNIENEINNKIDIKYNIYLNYKSKNIQLNKYKKKAKLDFCLLILILFQDNLLNHNILKNRLREVLIKAQNNFCLIKDELIKIKLSHFFKFAIPKLFNVGTDELEDNNNYINQNISFIETALNFLFNNLKGSDSEEYIFSDCLRNDVSEIIIYLCKNSQNENDILKDGINYLFQREFNSLINLIEDIKLYSFFSVIQEIITTVKIKNRNDLFNCIEKLTKRFIKENEIGDVNSQLYCPLYFSIISNFFKGINKIDRDDINFAEEINKFNYIFQPILDCLKDLNSFIYYENFIKAMTEYVKCFKGINEQSCDLIKIMLKVVERDRQFSEDNFHYLSAFLTFFQFNPLNLSQEKIFDYIIKILEKSFSYEYGKYDSSRLYSLLIALQIFNKNMNISNEINKILLSNTVKCFNYIFKEDENYGNIKMKIDKNNIIFGIIALGYIFKPEETYKILEQTDIMENKPKNFYGEFDYEKFNFNIYVEILNYINKYQIENELLRKCLILGFCSIIKNENLGIFSENNKNAKKKLILIFVHFILEHKQSEIKERDKIIKNELNYSEIKVNEDGKINFNDISNSEDEEEEEEEEIIQNKLNIDINYILEQNNDIKNSDEYKFFKESLDYLKQTDIDCINMLNKELGQEQLKQLEEIYYMKKIKVNYQGKEFEIPRKIVNIKKNL